MSFLPHKQDAKIWRGGFSTSENLPGGCCPEVAHKGTSMNNLGPGQELVNKWPFLPPAQMDPSKWRPWEQPTSGFQTLTCLPEGGKTTLDFYGYNSQMTSYGTSRMDTEENQCSRTSLTTTDDLYHKELTTNQSTRPD